MTAASDRYPGGRHRRLDTVPEVSAPQEIPAPISHPARAGHTSARWRLRPRSIRARVVSLLAVPVIAVMTLWGLATVTEVRATYTAQQIGALKVPVQQPMAEAAAALTQERGQAVRVLSQTSPSGSFGIQPATADAAVATAQTGAATAATALDALSPDLKAQVQTALGDFGTLARVQQQVSTRSISAADAYAAYTTDIEDAHAVGTTIESLRSASDATTGTRIGTLLGLPVIIISLLISVRIGRGLVVELVGLRDSALELAGRRLPEAIARLRSGGAVDLDAVAPLPAPDPAPDDEVGQVAEALAVVQRAALEAATERAEVVSGVARVFLNLARRSQILVHQQLTLLDAMERRIDDPEEVEDLYRLDHLATRMRRHAEGLIILSGSPPGRGWRRPVPLIDVLRSAAAEVEDFSRVDVRPTPDARVVGPAVADLTHLVAELIENATTFSPPYTRVTVRATLDGAVCVVEVEDRGLGMGDGALADANRRIADARPDDLFDSEQLGLFVVSRLARRHHVQVRLQRTSSGGTTAIVALPESVLAGDGDPVPENAAAVAEVQETPAAVPIPVPAAIGAAPGKHEPSGVRRGGPGSAPIAAREEPGPGLEPGGAERPAPGRAALYVVPDMPVPPATSNGSAESRPPASVVAPEATAAGLPRRVRQANLVPQLRDRTASQRPSGLPLHPAPDPEDGPAAPRDPETVRATMAAFQSGWTRGRHGAPDPDPLSDLAPDTERAPEPKESSP